MLRRNNNGLLLLGIVFLSAVVLLLVAACDPLAPIVVRNGTSETLWISIGDDKPRDVVPYGEIKNQTVAMVPLEGWFIIVAKDSEDNIIYQERFTYNELEWLEWRVLIPSSRIPYE